MSEQRLLTTREIASYCGVSFRTVIRWIERGELHGHRLPGRGDYRIPITQFYRFLEKNNMPIPQTLRTIEQSTILIIEDDPLVAKALMRQIHRIGLQYIWAKNGFQAGLMLFEHKPALITLDIDLPGLSGQDVFQMIQRHDALSHVKTLVVSAQPEHILESMLLAGADAYIKKPFDNHDLTEKIKHLIGIKNGE